jgi:hypothetical protein
MTVIIRLAKKVFALLKQVRPFIFVINTIVGIIGNKNQDYIGNYLGSTLSLISYFIISLPKIIDSRIKLVPHSGSVNKSLQFQSVKMKLCNGRKRL